MSRPEDHIQQAVRDLADALQVAAPLADRLGVQAVQQTRDLATLRKSLERAVKAVRQLHPDR